jgi:hypothetical protein
MSVASHVYVLPRAAWPYRQGREQSEPLADDASR